MKVHSSHIDATCNSYTYSYLLVINGAKIDTFLMHQLLDEFLSVIYILTNLAVQFGTDSINNLVVLFLWDISIVCLTAIPDKPVPIRHLTRRVVVICC